MNDRTFTKLFSLIVLLSGISGLSYELLWMRSVRGYFGDETVSVSLIVFIYFAGMGIGGFLAGGILRKFPFPLAIYAIAEIVIGLFGLASPWLLSFAQAFYLKLCGVLWPGTWLAAKITVIFGIFIVPSIMIGLTLPLIAAAGIPRPSRFTPKFSRYYSLNTAGAVAGVLLCGLYLIPRLGLTWTGRVIVCVNIAVAALLYISYKRANLAESAPAPGREDRRKAVFPAAIAFLLGAMSLSYEVAWIRIFCFYFIPSALSLALLLSVFIAGLALGSFLLSLWKKPITVARLGAIETAKAVAMMAAIIAVSRFFYANWETIAQTMTETMTLGNLVLTQFLFAAIVFLLPGIFMGMTFPLIERLWPSETAGMGRIVSLAASWNTWGGAAGAFLTGMVFIPWLGSAATLKLALFLSAAVAALLFLKSARYVAAAVLTLVLVPAIILLPRELNFSHNPDTNPSFEYYKEGRSGCVYVYKNQFNEKSLFISNTYVLGSEEFPAVRSQMRQGALPVILAGGKKGAILSIGLGTGITVAPLQNNSIAREVDAVEIVPEVIEASALFADGLGGARGAVNVIAGDGREFLARSTKKYEAIFSELYSPEFAGIGNLYSVEHLRDIRDHLSAGGIFCQCLALYQFNVETFRIAIRTFLKVFGTGSVWLIEPDFASPTVIIASGGGPFWTAENLREGTARFPKEIADKTAWHDAADVGVHFITGDLAALAGEERRINSIQYPWIEERSCRLVKTNHIAELRFLMDHRQWPSAWRDWEQGYSVWKAFGDLMEASIGYFSGNGAPELHRYLSLVDEVPETSRSLNAVKSYFYKKALTEIPPDSPVFPDAGARRAFAEKLLVKAVALDPFNYMLDWKLFQLYAGANDETKALAVIPRLLDKVPANVKAAGTFKKLHDFYVNGAGSR